MSEGNLSILSIHFGNLLATCMTRCAFNCTFYNDHKITVAICFHGLDGYIGDVQGNLKGLAHCLYSSQHFKTWTCRHNLLILSQFCTPGNTREPQYLARASVHHNLLHTPLAGNADVERVDETAVLDLECPMRHLRRGRFDACQRGVLG